VKRHPDKRPYRIRGMMNCGPALCFVLRLSALVKQSSHLPGNRVPRAQRFPVRPREAPSARRRIFNGQVVTFVGIAAQQRNALPQVKSGGHRGACHARASLRARRSQAAPRRAAVAVLGPMEFHLRFAKQSSLGWTEMRAPCRVVHSDPGPPQPNAR